MVLRKSHEKVELIKKQHEPYRAYNRDRNRGLGGLGLGD
jgi:hypothetical protein